MSEKIKELMIHIEDPIVLEKWKGFLKHVNQFAKEEFYVHFVDYVSPDVYPLNKGENFIYEILDEIETMSGINATDLLIHFFKLDPETK